MATQDFTHQRLALVTYSSIARDGRLTFVNRAFGLLIDDLAGSFKEIQYVAAEAPPESSLYSNCETIYNYSIKAPNVEIVPIEPIRRKSGVLGRICLMLHNQRIISDVVRMSDFVYIFLPSYSGLLTAFICLLRRIPYFLYFGSVWDETKWFRINVTGATRYMYALSIVIYPFLQRLATSHALFCLTAGRRLLEKHKLINSRTFETVPLVQFRKPLDGSMLRPAAHRGSKTVTILSVGIVIESKGIEYVVKALPYIISKQLQVKAIFVGGIVKDYYLRLLSEIENLGLTGHVVFAGYVNNVQRLQHYYMEADVLVHATLGEGFPRVLYEAMIARLPVVASDIQSIRDNLSGWDIVSFVPLRNPSAIADAILEIISNDELRARRVAEAYRFASMRVQSNSASQVLELLRRYGTLSDGIS